MMNKLQDLMGEAIQVQIVVDALTDRAHHKVVKGIIKNVSREFIEVGRPATGDEKSQLSADDVRIIIPMEKIGEVIYGFKG